MSFAGLMNHTVRWWRKTVTQGELGEDITTWGVLGEFPATMRRPTTRRGDTGPGMAPIGERVFYFASDQLVRSGDLLEVTDGPDSPGAWEVDDEPTRPRGHHTETHCRMFQGQVPVVGS